VKALVFAAVFLLVTVVVTAAALTGMFMFWSVAPVQPGTATALAMLFLVAPGLGIAAGVMAAIRAVSGPRPLGGVRGKWLMAGLAAVVGGLAGYGASMAAIDLTYTERWTDPGTAPDWLPVAPPVAGAIMAVLLGWLSLLFAGRGGSKHYSPDSR
jgi:hypothetical protein